MPFTLRVTSTPTLGTLTELERVVIVDQTGPNVPLGVSTGSVAVVGETLKGIFSPVEVFSDGELKSLFIGDPNRFSRMSQSAAATNYPWDGVQDGSGITFDGNIWAELKGKSFKRLVIQRVDCDMTTTDAGTAKAFVKFDVTIGAADTNGAVTARELVIPAGTRFADAALSLSTVIVATSQDIVIPKGTAIAGGVVAVTNNLLFNQSTGVLGLVTTGANSGATAFFVKGTTAAIAFIDTVIDNAVSGSTDALTVIAAAGISTINVSAAATAVFAATTAVPAPDTLANRIYSKYVSAIAKLLPGNDVTDDIIHTWSARSYASSVVAEAQPIAVRSALWTNAKDSSQVGRGRTTSVNTAAAAVTSSATAVKNAAKALDSEFGGIDGDRAFINFPYVEVFSEELSRNILVSPSGFKAALVNALPEEVLTSVSNNTIQGIAQLEPAFVANPLAEGDYISFKSNSVSALQRDRAVGWWFYSGVTAVNPDSFPTRVDDNRRRFADFVQDTLRNIAAPYLKQPGTTERVDSLVGEIEIFLTGLVSAANPSQQRIEGYTVDAVSLNTAQLTAIGIRTIEVKVRMLGDLKTIVFQTSIGPTVELTSQVA